ncbi:hypothetical protein AAC387_Pa04g1952 [Persea americana]
MTLARKFVVVPCKKLAKLFRTGFNSSKCKTVARLATSRIKLLRNKREAQIKQMRRDVALLLQSGQDDTARIRVEHVIREQNIMAANEIIELFCELIVVRLPIISKQRQCPADLKEGISSLIFAAPRCSDIPELQQIRSIFEKKYGKDFVSAATDLRPDCGVNRTLIEKLSVRTPTGQVKLKIMKDIAKEFQIEWDTIESEQELLKTPEERIEGPRTFVSAASMPVKSASLRGSEPNSSHNRSSKDGESCISHFKDMASAAQAAADSAEKAVAAAQAAAYLANQSSHTTQPACFNTKVNSFSSSIDPNVVKTVQDLQNTTHKQSNAANMIYGSRSSGRSQYMRDEETTPPINGRENSRRHNYNVRQRDSDIKFDDSDGVESDTDEETLETRSGGIHLPPPNRPPPPVPSSGVDRSEERTATDNSRPYKQNLGSRVHPKLPDYDSLSARFEALKFHKS